MQCSIGFGETAAERVILFCDLLRDLSDVKNGGICPLNRKTSTSFQEYEITSLSVITDPVNIYQRVGQREPGGERRGAVDGGISHPQGVAS